MKKIRNLLSSLFDTSYSSINQNVVRKLETKSLKLSRRMELFDDPFTRNVVGMTIIRSLGSDTEGRVPYMLEIKDGFTNAVKAKLQIEFDDIKELIDEEISEVILDSQILGDGYTKLDIELGKGVVGIKKDIRFSPMTITPIKHFKTSKVIAFRVNPLSSSIINTLDTRKRHKNKGIAVNNSLFLMPFSIARANGVRRTLEKLTVEQYTEIQRLENITSDFVIEDNLYGGVCDEVYNYYLDYLYAINALADTRISSSVLERFITHDLDELNQEKKQKMVDSLTKGLMSAIDAVRKKIANRDTRLSIVTHILPTTNSNGTGGISIQDSQPSAQGLQNIEDIMFMIKKYCVALGFPFKSTEFGEEVGAGAKEDSTIQQSILLEIHAQSIRNTTEAYIRDIINKHIKMKFGIKLEKKDYTVSFSSSINHAKALKSAQAVEVLTESVQFLGLIEQVKMQNLEDTPANREMLKEFLKDSMTKKETYLDSWIDIILAPPTENEEQQEQ